MCSCKLIRLVCICVCFCVFQLNCLPDDALTLKQYEALVEAGTIKGYAGKKYASAAEKYADDFYAVLDEARHKLSWRKVKDRASQELHAKIEQTERRAQANEQLTQLQAKETKLLKSLTFLGREIALINNTLIADERRRERKLVEKERRQFAAERERVEEERRMNAKAAHAPSLPTVHARFSDEQVRFASLICVGFKRSIQYVLS